MSSNFIGFNVGIEKLRRQAPFNTLFSIDPKVKAAIVKNMKQFGYDTSQPIVVWIPHYLQKDDQQEMVVIDGNTRLEAAIEAGIKEVLVHHINFNSDEEALKYAIHNQRNRRNLTESEILKCIEAVDQIKSAGRPSITMEGEDAMKLASIEANSVSSSSPEVTLLTCKSAEETAAIVGVSRSKVERSRAVLKDPEKKEEVLTGKKTVHKAYKEIRAKERKPKVSQEELEEPIESDKKATEEEKKVVEDIERVSSGADQLCFGSDKVLMWCSDCSWGFYVIPLVIG